MTRILTPEEIKIIDAAEAVLRSLCVGGVTSIDMVRRSDGAGMSFAHVKGKAYPSQGGKTCAENIQSALNRFHEDYPGKCTLALRRVAELEAELSNAREHAAKVCEVTK